MVGHVHPLRFPGKTRGKWVDLRENLQESEVFAVQNVKFSSRFSLKPSLERHGESVIAMERIKLITVVDGLLVENGVMLHSYNSKTIPSKKNKGPSLNQLFQSLHVLQCKQLAKAI